MQAGMQAILEALGGKGESFTDGPESQYQAVTAAVSPAVTTVDLDLGRTIVLTCGAGNVALNLTHGPAAGRLRDCRLHVIQDAVGGRAIAPLSVDGVAATLHGPYGHVPTLHPTPNTRTGLYLLIRPGADIDVLPGGGQLA